MAVRNEPSPVKHHIMCAMLPFCDRRLSLPRTNIAPVWTRSFPIAKEPATWPQQPAARNPPAIGFSPGRVCMKQKLVGTKVLESVGFW